MPQILQCIKSTLVPREVRDIQIALAVALEDIMIPNEHTLYQDTLAMARRMHAMGVRAVPQ